MRTYLGPIGFYPTSITRPILSHGLDDGDAVTLVRPEEESDDRRAEETMADVDRTLGALEPDISFATERVPHDDFEAATLACHRLIREAPGDRILVLGGGAREVLVPLTIAGLAAIDCIELVLGYSDVDHAVRELDLPVLTASLTESAKETLAFVVEVGPVSLPDLTKRSAHSKSTITRHVNDLDEADAVTTWRDGSTKFAEATLGGRLLLGSM